MIVFGHKRVGSKLIMKRYFKKRASDKGKRLDYEFHKLRKMWWHFKTRWEV